MEAAEDEALRGWADYLRELGIYELYHSAAPRYVLPEAIRERLANRPALNARNKAASQAEPAPSGPAQPTAGSRAPSKLPPKPLAVPLTPSPSLPGQGGRTVEPPWRAAPPEAAGHSTRTATAATGGASPRSTFSPETEASPSLPPELAAYMPKPQPLQELFAAGEAIPPGERGAALERLRLEIGDCTRCPLAYAGRHTIVFGEGDPTARLLFVGEGPGADEDATGQPFVGKAGQLLNNMISAMGLLREQVYIANIVKCRPPGNRAPEFAEATTCSQFLLRQIDIVRPQVIVALGLTAATYVLGIKQSLASLRGQWFESRGAKVAVTYHPAFLLRDPRQKAEAWKDLQRVMAELGLTPPAPRKA